MNEQPLKTQLIITADDYGFSNHIDKGVVDAAKSGLISSVAALPNGSYSKERLQILNDVRKNYPKQNDSKVNHLDIGCHFTITSGQALTPAARNNRFLSKKEYFFKYTKMKRARHEFDKKKLRVVLKDELKAQLEAMQSYIGEVDHLSSHHDSLIFFEDYYDIFLEVAECAKIAVRSPNMLPESREKNYYGAAGARLAPNGRFRSSREFHEFLNRRLQGDENWVLGHKSPDALFGGNYIVRPLFDGIWEERRQLGVARSKYYKHYKKSNSDGFALGSLDGVFDDKLPLEMRGKTVEICAHIISPDNKINYNDGGPITSRKKVAGKKNIHYYPGVSTSYFDGREIEYRLLEMMKKRIFDEPSVEVVKWQSLKTQK